MCRDFGFRFRYMNAAIATASIANPMHTIIIIITVLFVVESSDDGGGSVSGLIVEPSDDDGAVAGEPVEDGFFALSFVICSSTIFTLFSSISLALIDCSLLNAFSNLP